MAFLAPLAMSAAPRLLKLLAPFMGSMILFAGGFGACEVYEHKVPWGLSHKLVSARHDRDGWKTASEANRLLAIGWATSFGHSEAFRAQERKQAVAAVDEQAIACTARVAEARRSSAAIHTLINKEPPHDPQGCPVRQLMPADELRDALTGAARP